MMTSRDDAELCLVEAVHRLVGRDAATKVQDRIGGATVYIPVVARHDHWLARLIGFKNARLVSTELGGTHVTVGRRSRSDWHRDIVQLLSLARFPVSAIALITGLTDRNIRHIRSWLRKAGELPQSSGRVVRDDSESDLAVGETALTFYRPIPIRMRLTGNVENPVISRLNFWPRRPGDEPDEPTLADVIARSMHDADGNEPAGDQLRQYALTEGIKAGFRPYFEGMV